MRRSVTGFMKSMWLSGFSFTGHGSYTAVTAWGRLSALSLSVLILIVISAYTANLATFLIIKRASVSKLTGWEDALAQRSKICVKIGSAFEEKLLDYAGSQLRMIDAKGGDAGIREKLLQQVCDGYAVTTNGWDRRKVTEAFNAGCKFRTVGDRVKPGSSGAPMSVYGECQFLVIQGVSHALKQLADEDKLEELRLKAIRKGATMTESCLPGGSAEGENDAAAMGPQEMMGIIIIHGACLIISLLGFAISKVYRQVRPLATVSDSKDTTQPNTAAAVSNTEVIQQLRAVVAEEIQKFVKEERGESQIV